MEFPAWGDPLRQALDRLAVAEKAKSEAAIGTDSYAWEKAHAEYVHALIAVATRAESLHP
jgi:hypothetical protein